MSTVKCPPDNTTLDYFTQIILCDFLDIPDAKPDIEFITNTLNEIAITKIDVINVDLGDRDPASENIREKVIARGTVRLGIEYSADEAEQNVHFAHFDIPFQGIIGERPCENGGIDPNTGQPNGDGNRGLIDDSTFDIDNYDIHVCLEHVQFHEIDSRTIQAVLVLLIWLEEKTA
ncbi:SPOCS domain-containing protein [Pontibacillus sp. HMF3514]|uniref:SPOCS domain-containing protein n=1 Tax=Pontibacillus sp. HMF3514 TaxID=2692425 RepID=UPI001F27306F|nr:SPOCS domain-containing protein [Pontibacillus sp. HMF3514]